MLRPSKLLGSFHQLRYYFQTKLSELVQPANSNTPSLSHHQPIFTLFQKPTQAFFRSPTQRFGSIKTLQQCNNPPAYYATQSCHRPSLWTSQGQQFRSMMSTSGPTHPTSVVWSFPRASISGGRGFSRSFSTTKAPCAPTVQTNQAFQITRIFSPAGTKMNSPLNDTTSSSAKHTLFLPNTSNNSHPYNRIFATKNNGGMRELVDLEPSDHSTHHYVHQLSTKRKRNRTYHPSRSAAIIQHDEISSMRHHVTQHKNHTSTRKGPDKTVYLLIPLQMKPNTGNLDGFFIQQFSQGYHHHIHQVLRLLQTFQSASRQFEVVMKPGQLRLYFPSPAPKTAIEALNLLHSMGIQPNSFFSIEQEPVVNHDYFKDVQQFIDHIDTLIDHGPAFNKQARGKSPV